MTSCSENAFSGGAYSRFRFSSTYLWVAVLTVCVPSTPLFLAPLPPFYRPRRVFYNLIKREGVAIGTYELDYRVGAAFSGFLVYNGAFFFFFF